MQAQFITFRYQVHHKTQRPKAFYQIRALLVLVAAKLMVAEMPCPDFPAIFYAECNTHGDAFRCGWKAPGPCSKTGKYVCAALHRAFALSNGSGCSVVHPADGIGQVMP